MQYNNFVSLMDGFSIDDFSVYGIESYRDENTSLFEFNDEQAIIDEHAEGLAVEAMATLLVTGTSGTDIFVYDVNTHKWEARDRVAIADTYESYGSLADFLDGVINRIEEANA